MRTLEGVSHNPPIHPSPLSPSSPLLLRRRHHHIIQRRNIKYTLRNILREIKAAQLPRRCLTNRLVLHLQPGQVAFDGSSHRVRRRVVGTEGLRVRREEELAQLGEEVGV